MTRPALGKAHMLGSHALTKGIVNGKEVPLLFDCGAACSVVGATFLKSIVPDWEDKVIGDSYMKFRGCSEKLKAVGVVEISIIFAHNQGAVRIKPEFVVMSNATPDYFILGSDFLSLYGIDIVHSREKYFTIGNDNKKKKFALQKYRRILPVEAEKAEEAEIEQLPRPPPMDNEDQSLFNMLQMGPRLDESQQQDICNLVKDNKETFGLGLLPIGDIKNHEICQP